MRILEKAGVVEQKRSHWRWYRRNEKIIAEMMRRLKASSSRKRLAGCEKTLLHAVSGRARLPLVP